ncbi:MAG: hypothetical protein RID22_20310 [Roseibium aggregatum]
MKRLQPPTCARKAARPSVQPFICRAFTMHRVQLAKAGLLQAAIAASVACLTPEASAQTTNCDTYARAYADAHINPDQSDMPIVDGAMEGAVAGGAWEGPSGARRGALTGGALAVLDNLGSTPAGWRGLYDLAYRLCRNAQSPVTHRPSTLGDPSYRPALPGSGRPEPLRPAGPLAPSRPNN